MSENNVSNIHSDDYVDIKPFYESGYGNSRIFTARNNGRKVIIKALKAQYANDARCRALLHEEYDMTSLLDNRFIRKALDFVTIEGLGDCIIFEYIEGKSLAEHVRVGTLSEKQVKNVLVDVCDALAYMHRNQIVHCNLKPENIIVTANDWVDIEAKARADGVTGFLVQPVFPSDLHKVLQQTCGMACPVRIKKTAPDYSLQGKKILMVDDSHLNLKIGVILLREKGALVDTAENGQLALDLIREKGTAHYDVVVMDVQMPVMDGYQATAAIRSLPGGDKLKILAYSANAFEEDKQKSLRAGMNGHITKPLKITEFLKELRRFGV